MFWSKYLCRICSEICELCVPIFDETITPSIDMKIKRCMSVGISKDDMKPSQVCTSCLSKVNEFYNFMSLFHNSNYKFENMLFHCAVPNSNDLLDTADCDDLDLSLVHNPLSECDNLGTDIIPVQLDSEVGGLGDQQLLNEIDQVNILNAQTFNGEQTPNKNCVTITNYYILEPTPQTIYNRTKKTTLVAVPSLINNYKANKACTDIQPSKIQQRKTTKSIYKTGKFTCAKCSKVFTRKQRLTEHLLRHASSRPFMCEQCGKTFAVKWDCTLHKRTHTSALSCQYCSKCFTAPSKLQRHIRTHTNERPFVCKVENCGLAFTDKRNLVGHQVTHTNIRNFKCNICNQFYKTKSQLSDHLKAHSGVANFTCKLCGKGFKWKANLCMHTTYARCGEKYTALKYAIDPGV